MSFEFNFFDQQPPSEHNNLEEVMKKIEDESFRFDQFDPVDQNPNQKSFNSDFFKDQPKPEEKIVSAKSRGKGASVDFDNSRNLSQISYMGDEKDKSFHYESPPPPISTLKQSARYEKLQKMLTEAKKNNLDMFYKNLDQQNAYKVQQKFNSKEDFNNYRYGLKAYKRKIQQDFKQSQGQYNFNRNNLYKQPESAANHEIQVIFASKGDFKKKDSVSFNKLEGQSKNKAAEPKNLLPNEFFQEDQAFDFFEIGQDEINKQVKNYQNTKYMKQAQKFFQQEGQQNKQKKQKSAAKLQPIRQQRANLFQVTHESQKMTKLINNYDDMKRNFSDLMSNLKQTNTDHQRIISQLKNLKQEYSNKESRQKLEAETKKQKKVLKQREKQEKQKKMTQIKQQIGRLREGSDKDLLFLKINQKIQNLEEIVKNAINEMNQQKQHKFVPKIINYYKQQSPQSSRQNSQGAFSRQEGLNQNQGSQIRKLQEQQLLAPVRNALKQLKQERRQQQMLYNLDAFCSPLQLDLTTQQFPLNLSRNRSQQLQQPFVPPNGAKQYLPNTLDTTNKYLRRCLTQKSSVIFQSFEFYITGKFTMTNNERYPVLCEVRVANKCAVSLYDVFVVVFGPQAQQSQLQMRPNKLMHDQFRHSTSFLFEVDLSKSCLQNGGFSVMISYKSDSVNKKKVVFKVILPFVQLIKPEFIYEQQLTSGWNHLGNQTFIMPKALDFKNIRSHQDLKLIMPFIEVGEYDPNAFSYGIMFRYPTSQVVYMMKITCYVNGKASIHLKSSQPSGSDRKMKEEILDIMNYLCFG